MKRGQTVHRWVHPRGWCLWCGEDFGGRPLQTKFCNAKCRREFFDDLDDVGPVLCNATGGEA